MKYLKILLLSLLVISCSQDGDNATNAAPSGDGNGGSLAIFALKGDYLYTVDHMKLNVFSLINETQPVKVNEIMVGFNIETLFSNGEYLFIGSQNGMFIYSVSNPENPVQLANVLHFNSCDPVVANDTHAFVTLHSNSTCGNDINVLQIYDTANPLSPMLIHQRNLTNPKGLGLYHNFLLVCDEGGIKIFNIQNPSEPVLVSAINKECFDVIIRGDDLYAIGADGIYKYLLNQNNMANFNLQSQVLF